MVALSALALDLQSPRVLFLDFDGVLHVPAVYRAATGRHVNRRADQLFEHASFVASVLDRAPAVRVVLSTSWVPAMGLARTLACMPEELASRVIGATFVDGMDEEVFVERPRHAQIIEFVRARSIADWVAVDEDVEGWPPEHAERLVGCRPDTALASGAARALFERRVAQLQARAGRFLHAPLEGGIRH